MSIPMDRPIDPLHFPYPPRKIARERLATADKEAQEIAGLLTRTFRAAGAYYDG